MRAAVVQDIGEPPAPGEAAEPERGSGEALVEVTAAALNPIDISVGSGRFYAGPPELPYVPGMEGVGRVLDADSLPRGARVYFRAPGGNGGRSGAIAERAAVDEQGAVVVEADVGDALAASLGIAGLAAWLALEWRAELRPGETVLVLGATGAVGTIAVQAAKLLGAGRVIAAGRDARSLERLRERGADALVELSGDRDLVEVFVEAAGGEGIDVTVDPLWGAPAVAAAKASATGARLIQLGQSAAAEATIPSAAVRGKLLAILGHTNFAAPAEVRNAAYLRMLEHAAAGRLAVEVETFALDQVSEAWRRQASFPHHKLVVVP